MSYTSTRIVAIVASCLCALYLLNTFLYLTPPNPVKLHLLPVIYRLQHPFFAQNWHLFAPNPVRSDHVLAVRCRTVQGVTTWYEPFTPLLYRHHRNRLTPVAKILRVPYNAMFLVLGRTTDEWVLLLCRRDQSLPSCRREDPTSLRQLELARSLLVRIASRACDELGFAGRTIQVQVRILIYDPPPWSRRLASREAGTTRHVTLPWAAHQEWRSRQLWGGFRP